MILCRRPGAKRTHTGEGTSACWPVAVNLPLSCAICSTAIPPPSCPAVTNQRPEGSIPKPRGVLTRHGDILDKGEPAVPANGENCDDIVAAAGDIKPFAGGMATTSAVVTPAAGRRERAEGPGWEPVRHSPCRGEKP